MPSDATERWSELAAMFAVPELAVDHSESEVTVGQLRQATWSHADAMVIIDQIDDVAALAHVYPASVEPGTEGLAGFVIESSANPFNTAIGVWPAHAHWIPFASLDSLLATFDPALLRALRDVAASDDSGQLPDGAEDHTTVDELLDAIDALEDAPRIEPRAASAKRERLDLDVGEVMQTLGATQSRAMNILMGTEPVTPDEADLLSKSAGISSTTILNATLPLPDDLVRELHEPRWRQSIRRRAAEGNEQAGRLRLGYDVYQLAARQTGAGRDLWRQRLETLLATEEHNA